MMGRGPQMSKSDQNEPNNDPYLNSGEVKYPLFEAEFLPPNRHQTSWYRSTKYIIRLRLDNGCLHTSGFAAETPSGESSLVRCSFGLAGPAHFLLALAGEEGVFNRHLGAVSRRLDTPDSISRPEPSTRELSFGLGSCCSGSHTSLKLQVPRINTNLNK